MLDIRQSVVGLMSSIINTKHRMGRTVNTFSWRCYIKIPNLVRKLYMVNWELSDFVSYKRNRKIISYCVDQICINSCRINPVRKTKSTVIDTERYTMIE